MRKSAMRLALLLAAASPLPVGAQDQDQAIENVISSQIEAFQANDLDRAFTFASPMIQEMFNNPERFGVMVQRGYPMVWRPSEVTMGELRQRGDRLVQSVILRDASGALHIADYEMIQIDGAWRINGVWIRPASDTGA